MESVVDGRVVLDFSTEKFAAHVLNAIFTDQTDIVQHILLMLDLPQLARLLYDNREALPGRYDIFFGERTRQTGSFYIDLCVPVRHWQVLEHKPFFGPGY